MLPRAAFNFGPFRLVPSERLLLENGRALKIGSRALDILIALVRRAGEVIPHDDLIAAGWPDTFVEPGNLRVHITALRKVLSQSDPTTDYITNIPGRGYCFVAPTTTGIAASRAPQGALTPNANALPRLRRELIGRSAALELLERQLDQQPVLSLVGPGGIGKTSIAVALADRVAGRFPDAVTFVDLSALSDAAVLSSTIAEKAGCVLGSPDPLAELVSNLRHRSMLLVLDSCEHLVHEVALLAETLAGQALGVTILVTSREPLRIQGEWVFRVPPLEFPSEGDANNAETALKYAAVQLFVQRVSRALGGYALRDEDATAVGEICRRLDGIVLAIELAAGRVDTLGILGLVASLRESFDGLSRGRRTALPRHQTLRATLDWSYALLTDEQKSILARLSLFNKEFTLQAAMAVVSDGGSIDVESCIGDLVAKSLVVADRGVYPVRYHLLDMTRAYAAEKLSAFGFGEEAARRHAAYFRTLFDHAAEVWQADQSADWLDLYGRDIGNLRVALDWAFSPRGNTAIGVALAVAAIPLWYQLSLVDECLFRVRQALDWLEQQPAPDQRSLMKLHAALGFPHMRAISGRPSGAEAWSRTLQIARSIGDVDFQLRALWALWVDRTNGGEPREALEKAETFHQLAARSRDRTDVLIGDRMRARSLHLLGDQVGAEVHVRRMLENYPAQSNRLHLGRFQYDQRITARITFARVLWVRGHAREASAEVEDLVEAAITADHNLTLSHVLADAACPISFLSGDIERAEHYTAMLHQRTQTHALDVWHSYSECFEGGILICRGEASKGVALSRAALDRLGGAGFLLYHSHFQSILASGLKALGRGEEAVSLLDDAFSRCERTGESWFCPELLRLKAELLVRQGDESEGRKLLTSSLAMARVQGAGAWEKRVLDAFALLNTD